MGANSIQRTGRRQKAEGRKQKAESRRQEVEGRKQKAEGSTQKAEGRSRRQENDAVPDLFMAPDLRLPPAFCLLPFDWLDFRRYKSRS
jgi:uncharacterized protein YjbJ (UPF0337 family)